MAKVIYIEGSDYSGKTTLLDNLKEILVKKGAKVLTLNEPNGYYRDRLLYINNNLSFFSRRQLFMTCFMETREKIKKLKKDYDYILVDRCAIISDLMHIGAERPDNIVCFEDVKEEMVKYYDRGLKLSRLIDDDDSKPSLIVAHVPLKEFYRRIESREIDKSNVNDLKGMDFKLGVFRSYAEFCSGRGVAYHNVNKFFSDCNVCVNRSGLSPTEYAQKIYERLAEDGIL